jgi:CRISPR/Cas system-associated exonuclease Cas4 (RecB family)
MSDDGDWTSPSDLADYAYCPRSHWYRHHPPPRGPSSSSVSRSALGEAYHARTLSAELRRDEHRSAYWVAVLIGVLLAALGVLWLFHL